jgi:hypothetical protein
VTYWKGDAFDLCLSNSIPPGLPNSKLASDVRKHILERVAEAKAFHTKLGLSKHAVTYAIVGNGRETDTKVFFDVDHPNAPDFVHKIRPTQGDGTVPAASAGRLFPGSTNPPPFTPSVPQYEVDISSGKEHSKIYLNDSVQGIVFDILRHLISGPTHGAVRAQGVQTTA